MKKILLTGGSGFIGRNILESFLMDKYEILAPRHSELDLLDYEAVDAWVVSKRPDYIIHSAVKPGHRNANDTTNLLYSNARMFFNLARNAPKVEKIVILGSGAIYDTSKCHPLMKEDEWIDRVPIDEHGFCKYICANSIEKSPNMLDLRIFGIFGKHEDYSIRFISNMICKAMFDLPLTIKQDRIMSYLYVDDLMPILDGFLSGAILKGSFNVTPSDRNHLVDIAKLVLNIMKKKLPIKVALSGNGIEYSGDNARLMETFPNTKFSKLEDTIVSLLTWYETNRTLIDRSKLLFDK